MRAAIRRVALAHRTFGTLRDWAVRRFEEGRRVRRKRVRRFLRVEGPQLERHFPRPWARRAATWRQTNRPSGGKPASPASIRQTRIQRR